jgi:hypothetical protein
MATAIDIAEALVAALNGGSFSQAFTAQWIVDEEPDLKDLVDTLRVDVIPSTFESDLHTRNSTKDEYTLRIAVRKKIAAREPAAVRTEITGLLGLVEEIRAFVKLRDLDGTPRALWFRTEHRPIYSPRHLRQLRQFTALLAVSYLMEM